MEEIVSDCPASLSFIFKAIYHDDPIKSGSIGIGCTVDKRVEIVVEKSSISQIFFNGKTISFPTVLTVLKSLTNQPLKIKINSSLPLGYGFGVSGAAALATAYAINKLLSLKKSMFQLAEASHSAEIINHTGLGSVATQITGGFLLKNKPGIPGKYIRLPFTGKKLYAVIIGKLTTPTVIGDLSRIKKINQAADKALEKIRKYLIADLADIIDISYQFSINSGLLTDTKVKDIISNIRNLGGHATMSMLGQVVISDTMPKIKKKYHIEKLTITNDKVCLF